MKTYSDSVRTYSDKPDQEERSKLGNREDCPRRLEIPDSLNSLSNKLEEQMKLLEALKIRLSTISRQSDKETISKGAPVSLTEMGNLIYNYEQMIVRNNIAINSLIDSLEL